MTRTTSLYETCQNLFRQYPLAINENGAMTLMLDTGRDPQFFILIYWDKDDDGGACFDLIRWRNPDVAATRIEVHTGTEDAPDAAGILTHAVPLPRDGSLFAWQSGGMATTLVAVYAHYTPETPEPSWSTMPLQGEAKSSWPPFTAERLFGAWFWDHYAAGRIVYVAPLAAETPGVIFWASPDTLTIGCGCCVVARDVTSSAGWTLPQGAYVYFESLQNGETTGPLDELLAGDVADLSSRFQTEN